MRRDWTVIVIGLCFAAVATVLVVVSIPERLPSCEAVSGNIDGTGGDPCGDGLQAWSPRSLPAGVVAGVLYAIAIPAIAIGARRRRIER
jgi:hypothetical protein